MLPHFGALQVSDIYYSTLLNVNNLSIIDFVHKSMKTREIKEHCYAHIYLKCFGEKGSNNVCITNNKVA